MLVRMQAIALSEFLSNQHLLLREGWHPRSSHINLKGKMSKKLYDKTGRQILIGDVLKVFHFIGRRRKRHYMYKHVVGVKEINGTEYLVLDHLDKEPSTYTLRMDNSILEDYEIVQGYSDNGTSYEDRPRVRDLAMSDNLLETLKSRYPQLDWHEAKLLAKSPNNPYFNAGWGDYDIDIEYLADTALYSVKVYDEDVILHSVKKSLDAALHPLDRFFETNSPSLSSE